MNKVRKVLEWIGAAIAWLYRYSLGRYLCRLRGSSDFRRGSAGTVLAMSAFLVIGLGVSKLVTQIGDMFAEIDFSEPIDPAEPEYVEQVRLARDRLGGFNEDILPYVLDEYNKYASNPEWHSHAQRCLKHETDFKRAEKLTLYPWIMTAGMALHESKCNERVRSYDNGRGLMQITKYDPRHEKAARELLGVRKVDFVGEPFHNIVLGIVIHDDYERRWRSREHGMLSYNRGVAGTRSDMRQCGWKKGEPLLSVTEIRPCLAYKPRGWKPRTYTPRVLATVVMMNRLVKGEPLVQLERIRPSDIPGWDPSDDGETSWFSSLW